MWRDVCVYFKYSLHFIAMLKASDLVYHDQGGFNFWDFMDTAGMYQVMTVCSKLLKISLNAGVKETNQPHLDNYSGHLALTPYMLMFWGLVQIVLLSHFASYLSKQSLTGGHTYFQWLEVC